MKKVILITAALLTMASSAFAQIGSLSADLVFTPITPCRIVDTRGAGGVIPAASSRAFKGTAANFATQGGSSTGCTGLPTTASIAALAVNLLVIVPAAEGWIAAWPVGTTMPLVSNLNYKANDVLANSAVLKINTTSADFNVYTVASTHLAVDVTGYYSRPVSVGSLECVMVSSTFTVAAGGRGTGRTPLCTAGYVQISGGVSTGTNADQVLNALSPSGTNNGWFYSVQNTGATTKTFDSETVCCRIPGR